MTEQLRQACETIPIRGFLAVLGGFFSWLMGGFDVALAAVFVLYALDFGLGFYIAWQCCSISGEKIKRGLVKSLLYCSVIIAAHMVDIVLSFHVPLLAQPIRAVIVSFIAANEFLSVVVHLDRLGVRVPKPLIRRLKSFRDGECVTGGKS